ncbi:PLD nuclease N-terminal domain-containing protein [Cytobacillus oceanisediminis]|uniref:PLD nuclease N-terminal domain-containing protein n=1 Tax=Cytobacillus oceanisediminis TaxID=665099 RepID=UPI0023DBEAE6|nr:PLD nuclease N-terminal domain-containing protein [Cytobacillus oceanisediminis]MDF2035395.1 PLD nuclease N-terminal domain-containing protein [Cytobacillus oceanisediminis]
MEFIESINWAILAPIIIIQLILMTAAIIDLVKIEKSNGPKWVWALVILFINLFGPIIYFIFGRRS